MPVGALVVEPVLQEVLPLVSSLSAAGFQVTVSDHYDEARGLLALQPPAVFVTAVRLGEYNGLQLVLRARAARPAIAAIVLSDIYDSVLEDEAQKMGATFVQKPIDERHLLAAVFRTLARGGSNAPPLRPPFERRLTERRHLAIATVEERRQQDRRLEPHLLLQRFAAG